MPSRIRRAIAFVGFGLACAAGTLPFASRLPNFLVPDDGFFYAQIAYNLAERHHSTFDGVHTTSGYHLPWGFVLAAISLIVGLLTKAKEAHLYGHLAISFTLIGWTTHTFFRAWPFRCAAFVLFATHFSLTEMALAVPLVLALLRESTPGLRRWKSIWSESALAFALALVRIDLCCVPLWLALTHTERNRSLRLSLATFIGASTQALIMRTMFGHFLSVAAELKTDGALRAIRWVIPLNLSASPFTFFTYTAHVLIAVLAIKLTTTRATTRLAIAATCFIAIHVALSIVRPWYMTPGWLMLLFVLERAVETSTARRLWRNAALTLIGLLTLAFVIRSARVETYYRGDQATATAALADLRRLVPAETVIFTFDNPGYLGFFSGLRVVDGDGLVNDYAYARRLRAGTLAGYLEEERICWIVTDSAGTHPQLKIGGLEIDTPDLTLLSDHRRDHLADFLLYRLNASRCRGAQRQGAPPL